MNPTRQRPDDQYVMPVEASRRGAHRARVSPLIGALPFVAVAVVVTGVVLLAWTLFGGAGDTTQSAGAVSTAPSAAGEPSPSEPGEPSPDASGEPSPQESQAEPTPTPKPSSVVDKTQAIVVRNSTQTTGLARGAAARLEDEGWSIDGTPDNVRPAIDSTVFYAADEQRASARAVAKVLGIDAVKKNASRAEKGITVILGPDYQP